MSDIIDIVHRLSYEVDDKSIDRVIQKLQKEATIIDGLIKREDNLAVARKNASSAFESDQITAQISKNRKEIDLRTAALQKTFTEDKKLQAALNDEIGIIERLTQLMKTLKIERSAATNPAEVAALTQSITQIGGEIKRLTTANKGGGAIFPAFEIKREIGLLEQLDFKLKQIRASKLLIPQGGDFGLINKEEKATIARINQVKGTGVDDAKGILSSLLPQNAGALGSQILGGTLRGLAIGSGFGIVTRLVDALVQYGITLFDTEKRTEALVKANDELISSLGKLGEEIVKETNDMLILANAQLGLENNSVDGLKRREQAIKALGITNGEVYKAEKDQLEAANTTRSQELIDLQNKEQSLKKIAEVINKSQKQTSDYFNKPEVKAFGDPTKNKNVQFEAFNILNKNIQSSPIPDDVKVRVGIALNKAYKEGGDLLAVLIKENTQYQVSLVGVTQEILNNKAATEAANTTLNSKQREQEYELNRTLLIALRKDEAAYNVQRLKDYDETAARIRDGMNIERNQAIKEVDGEIELAQKKGIYTTQIESDYATKKSQINRKYNLQLIEQYQDFVRKYTKIGDDIEKIVIKSQPGSLTALLNPEKPDLQAQQNIAESKNKALLSEFGTYAESLQQRAIKNEITQLEIEKELGDKKLILQKSIDKNLVEAYFDYYKQIEKLAEDHAVEEIAILKLQSDSQKEKHSFDLLKGKVSPKTYEYLNQKGALQNSISSNQVSVNSTKTELAGAYNVQSQLRDNPLSQKPEIDAANAEVGRLEDKLANLNTAINEEKVNLNKLTLEHIANEISAYANLANAALSAYQQINEAHAKYLDTEISIQTERVHEAEVLAQRGNTAALTQSEDVLRKQEQQKELYARRQIEINSALAVSNALVAVAEAAAAGGGVISPALIAAVIAALGAGYAAVTALNSPSSQPGFAKGVIGFQGAGTGTSDSNTVRISKGESIITAASTKKHRTLLEAIQKDNFDSIPMINNDRFKVDNSGISKTDLSVLAKKMDENTEAVRESKVHAEQRIDRHGVAQIITQQVKSDRRRWGG